MEATAPQAGASTKPRPVDPGKARRTGWLLSATAGLLALLAGMAFFLYLNNLEAEIGNKQLVVVAAKPIPARALITPDMLSTVELPVKYLPPSYILSANDLVDGSTTALINIAPGEYVQQNMVSRNSGLDSGTRAVSIAVNGVTSVGNSVRQGNFVDLVASFVDTQGQVKTEMLLQNVKVLAVDTLLPAQGGTGGQTYLPAGVEGQVKLAPTTVVTLQLNPNDALKVIHASNFARELRLVIRRLDEAGTANLDPVQFIGGDPANGTGQNGVITAPNATIPGQQQAPQVDNPADRAPGGQ